MKPVDKAPGGGRGGPSKCTMCGKPATDAFRPFCSKRCADLDLGRWLRGHYVVPGEPGDADESPSGET